MMAGLTDEARHELDDLIIDRVVQAHAAGKPITVVRGPGYDIRLKRELKVGVHQGMVCAAVKQLVATGMLQIKVGKQQFPIALGSGRVLSYPRVKLLPA